jgi:tight adherence protein B
MNELAYGGGLTMVLALGLMGYALASPAGTGHQMVTSYLDWLGDELQTQYYPQPAWHVLLQQLGATVACIGGGLYVSNWFWLFAPMPFGLTRFGLRKSAAKRIHEIEGQLSDWLMALANGLKVSGSIVDAMAQTLELTRAPLVPELDRTVKEVKLGATIDTALRDLAARIPSPLLAAAVTTMVVGRRTGGALPTLLRGTAAVTRERLRLERMFRQHLAAARTQFFALALGPPLLIAILDKLEPGFFDPALESATGIVILLVCAGLWMISILMARRIMTQVL